INFANADVYAGDTITFAPGLEGTLAIGLGALPAITASSLAITGPGANLLTIDGQNSSNILTIKAGAGVILSGLTLAHGKASSLDGGAIDNSGTLAMLNCAVTDSTAAQGGGIFNERGAALAMIGCTLSGNSTTGPSTSGGGIFNYYGTVNLTNCTVYDNTATGSGGGICNEGGSVTLTDSTLADNSASSGGALDNVSLFPTSTA